MLQSKTNEYLINEREWSSPTSNRNKVKQTQHFIGIDDDVDDDDDDAYFNQEYCYSYSEQPSPRWCALFEYPITTPLFFELWT